jgi:hypothetical protein
MNLHLLRWPAKLICMCSLLNIFAHQIIDETEGGGGHGPNANKSVGGNRDSWVKKNTRIREVDEDVVRIRWLLSSNLNKATKSYRRAGEGVRLCCARHCRLRRIELELRGTLPGATHLNMQLSVAGRGLGQWEPCYSTAGPLVILDAGLTHGWKIKSAFNLLQVPAGAPSKTHMSPETKPKLPSGRRTGTGE